MEHNKKINRAGGISIPASLRREYGIEAGEKVNIIVDDQGVIRITRIEGACVFCSADQDLKLHFGRYICKNCREVVVILNEGGQSNESSGKG
jgi:transcriptional pleiotropic regulator of transition state genes